MWFLTNSNFAEMGIFIMPAILLLIFFYDEGSLQQKVFLFIIYLSLGLYKLYETLFVVQRAAAKVVEHSIDTILNRSIQLIARLSLLPEPVEFYVGEHYYSYVKITFGLIILVSVFGLICYIRNKDILPAKHRSFIVFYLTFSILAALPFLLVSPWFVSRHIFASSLAFFVLIIYLLYLLLDKSFNLNKTIIITIMLAILLFTGIHRHYNQLEHNARLNRGYNRVCNVIQAIPERVPEGQYVLTNVDVLTGGYFVWSSGFISYCLNEPGITGIIGREYGLYDPFNTEKRGYDYTMNGLDINKPLYAAQFGGADLVYHQYFLRWFDAERSDSKWIVYKRNEDTKLLEEFISGEGLAGYIAIFDKYGLMPEDILWGRYEFK